MYNKFPVNRLAYILAYGDFDETLSVLHTCDETRCINPEHLFLGTQSDNMKDMWDKGRRYIDGMFNPNFKDRGYSQ